MGPASDFFREQTFNDVCGALSRRPRGRRRLTVQSYQRGHHGKSFTIDNAEGVGCR